MAIVIYASGAHPGHIKSLVGKGGKFRLLFSFKYMGGNFSGGTVYPCVCLVVPFGKSCIKYGAGVKFSSLKEITLNISYSGFYFALVISMVDPAGNGFEGIVDGKAPVHILIDRFIEICL